MTSRDIEPRWEGRMPASLSEPLSAIFADRQSACRPGQQNGRMSQLLFFAGDRDEMSKNKSVLTCVLALWLGCASRATSRAQDTPRANWTSTEVPCANYDDLRNPVRGDIGVKIDATDPWAEGFRRAFTFWNTVLAANFYEETDLDACAVRIVNAGPEIVTKAIAARSQLTDRDNFRGKVAVNREAPKAMSNGALYGVAVHEVGHLLGLNHNASSQSIMYFLNVNGTEVLDRKDLLDLSTRHKLRAGAVPAACLPIKVIQIAVPTPSASLSSADGYVDSPSSY
jgi:hypothetical protein